MRTWNQVPLFRLLLPFLAGILLEIFYPVHNQIFLLILPVLLSIILLFTYSKKIYRKISIRWIYGITLNLAIFLIGIALTFYNSDKNSKNHFSYLPGTREYLGVLVDLLHEKKNSYKTIVEIKSVRSDKNVWKHVNGNVLVYFAMDISSAKLKYGDAIIFSAAPKEVELPKNPEEFNYKRFLSFHNIHHQVYLSTINGKA